MKRNISPGQIKLIRILKHRLDISEDNYRAALKYYGDVGSTKELSYSQASDLIAQWKEAAIKQGLWHDNESKSRHAGLANRGAGFATISQLDALDKAWRKVTTQTTEEAINSALDKMCQRICKRASVVNLLRADVEKMFKVLSVMTKEDANENI